MRKQRAALEDVADAPAQAYRIGRADILALDRDGAAVRLDQAVGQPQQRGLARTGAADNGEELALGHLERDIVHRCHAPAVEAFCDVCVGDQGRCGHGLYSSPSPGGGGIGRLRRPSLRNAEAKLRLRRMK
jgi:hypothetical protein